jgi:hypothetical protein
MEILGVLAGKQGQADHGILVDFDQATGLTHATTLLQMLQDGEDFVLSKFGTIQRSAFAFREAFLAGAASQNTPLFVGAIAETNTQVVLAALTVVGTGRVLAAEVFQVVHGSSRRRKQGEKIAGQLQSA